jgi:hypothetical protein
VCGKMEEKGADVGEKTEPKLMGKGSQSRLNTEVQNEWEIRRSKQMKEGDRVEGKKGTEAD